MTRQQAAGERRDIKFCWLDVSSLEDIQVYPVQAKEKLIDLPEHIEQFVYIEE